MHSFAPKPGSGFGAQIWPLAQSTCAGATVDTHPRAWTPHEYGGTSRVGCAAHKPMVDVPASNVMSRDTEPTHLLLSSTFVQAFGTSTSVAHDTEVPHVAEL